MKKMFIRKAGPVRLTGTAYPGLRLSQIFAKLNATSRARVAAAVASASWS